MAINGFYLLPHPPIVIPEVGGEEVKKIQATYNSMNEIGKDVKGKSPDTIILISPHGSMFGDAISLLDGETITGDFGNFGAPQVKFNKEINIQLTNKIFDLAKEKDIPLIKSNREILESYKADFKLDHGAMVPLYFIDKYYETYNIVHITYAPLDDKILYDFGKVIQEAAKDFKAILIASGDLSHRLAERGPYDFHPHGLKFDKKLLSLLERGDRQSLLNMDKTLIENAGECGMRSILILVGAIDRYDFKGELLSYEGTFGVGYGVMKFQVVEKSQEGDSKLKNNMGNPYVRLAKDNLTHFLNTGKSLEKIPSYISEEMKREKGGVFVTLHKGKELRGCIGTILPTTDSIYEEILRNSVSAGIYDPRFRQVERDELDEISFSVDILDRPQPASIGELDPKNYGIILSSGNKNKKGLLLPNLDGVETVEDQISITKMKAGIGKYENFTIESFKVTRYEED